MTWHARMGERFFAGHEIPFADLVVVVFSIIIPSWSVTLLGEQLNEEEIRRLL